MAKMPQNPLNDQQPDDISPRKTRELPLRDNQAWSGRDVDATEQRRLEWQQQWRDWQDEQNPAPPAPNRSGSTYRATTRETVADVPWA